MADEDTVVFRPASASTEEVQAGWNDLTLRVTQLESERTALEQENKSLRLQLEKVIEHRQKSHSELVLLLTDLVSKLPLNDVGMFVSKLVEHNTHVGQVLIALRKGTVEADVLQPAYLKSFDKMKRNLQAALKPLVEELIRLDPPLETGLLKSLFDDPEQFFSPRMLQANRCFLKGQVPRERVVREFGEEALVFFNDLTTDPKLNPRPKPDEIVLGFKNDFEKLFAEQPDLIRDKRDDLMSLYKKVQRSKAATDEARAQKQTFLKMSFVLELLHYYENQNTEPADVIFAQRLPALIEQLVIPGPQDGLEEKLITQAEDLLALVINTDHRQMIINNVGKASEAGKTLKFVLKLRAVNVPDLDQVIPEFVKHLLPAGAQAPQAASIAAALRLVKPDMQRLVVKGIMSSDRMPKDEAASLGKSIGKELGLEGLEEEVKTMVSVPPEMERRMAWDRIKDLVNRRADPTAVAAAIRERLHARYDADEVKQSWVTLTEIDPLSLIKIYGHLPYLADGTTDSIARTVMETYVTRLMHEKYAATYAKVVNSLKAMYKANPASAPLLNFIALVKWVDGEAAQKISADIGMAMHAH